MAFKVQSRIQDPAPTARDAGGEEPGRPVSASGGRRLPRAPAPDNV